MKSKQQKRKEANERAAIRSKLSDQRKLEIATDKRANGFGECKREIDRLTRLLDIRVPAHSTIKKKRHGS